MAPSPGDDDDDDEKRRYRFVKINVYSFMCLLCKKNPLDCILTIHQVQRLIVVGRVQKNVYYYSVRYPSRKTGVTVR